MGSGPYFRYTFPVVKLKEFELLALRRGTAGQVYKVKDHMIYSCTKVVLYMPQAHAHAHALKRSECCAEIHHEIPTPFIQYTPSIHALLRAQCFLSTSLLTFRTTTHTPLS